MFRSERMRRTGARSSASGTSSHMQSWEDCITGTHESSFWKRQWSSPVEGDDKRMFFAVLHLPPITSPVEAVRAAIVAEHNAK
jgi:hypothetical protein